MAQPIRVMPAGACGTMLVNAKVISAAAIATTAVIVNAFARTPCLVCVLRIPDICTTANKQVVKEIS